MLIGISEKNQVTHKGENAIICNNTEQHIFKDTIAQFGFGFKIPKFCLYIIKYRADPIRSLYGALKNVKTYLDVLNAKTQMQKKLELKSGYKTFKSFQATVVPEQNLQLCSYEIGPQKAQSCQPSLLYQDEKRVKHNISYSDHSHELH